MSRFGLFFIITLLTGCTTFGPVGTLFEIGEAAKSHKEVKEHPDVIETVITKEGNDMVVQSNSERSIVQQPIPQPTFSPEKAIDGVPKWLIVFNILLGIIVVINSYKSYRDKKRGDV